VDNISATGFVTVWWRDSPNDGANDSQIVTFVLNLKDSSGTVIATSASTPEVDRENTQEISIPTSLTLCAGGLNKSETYTVETTISRNNTDNRVRARDAGLSISGMSISS